MTNYTIIRIYKVTNFYFSSKKGAIINTYTQYSSNIL